MQLVINSPGTFITQKDECFRLKQKERVFDLIERFRIFAEQTAI
jgi:hypothetical protein